MNQRRRTIWLYYLYKVTESYGFVLAFTVIYLRHQGYGLDVIGLTQSAFLFSVVAMEVPAGYVADSLGRRTSLGIGNALTAVGMGGFPFVESVPGWVGLYALWGVAWSFHSAIGDAWLYAFLGADGDESEFAETSGRAESVKLFASASAAVAAGGLYVLNPDLPFFANAILSVSGIPLLVLLPSTRSDSDAAVSVGTMLRVLRLQVSRPEIRWLVLYSAVFNALFSATRWLEQPALDSINVPVAAFGLLFASFKLLTAAGMMKAGWIQEQLGPRRFFLLLVPVVAIAYASLAVVPLLVVPLIYLRRVLARVSGPIRNQYLNDRLDDVGRATVLSGASMVMSLASGLTSVLFGQLAQAVGPVTFLSAAGPTIAVLAGLLWLTTAPVRTGGVAATRATAGAGAGAGSD